MHCGEEVPVLVYALLMCKPVKQTLIMHAPSLDVSQIGGILWHTVVSCILFCGIIATRECHRESPTVPNQLSARLKRGWSQYDTTV